MTTLYERAPGIYLMFAKRFVPWRNTDASWPYDGLSETVLLSSRDGQRFERTFMEPFVRPGLDPLNWHDRARKNVILPTQAFLGRECRERWTKAVRRQSSHRRPHLLGSQGKPARRVAIDFTTATS
jgi:hypothetical protein